MIIFTLPLPPTINSYYGFQGSRRFVKPAGLAFRKLVADIVSEAGYKTLESRLSMFVAIYPADRRKQDIDNRIKSLADALTHAGVWLDDEQLDELTIVRREVIKPGQVKIVITEITKAP